MRPWFLIGLLLVTGCNSISILDPAIYRPETDPAVLAFGQPVYTTISIQQFRSLDDAGAKLKALSEGYLSARDALMRQQLLFDVPMFGLAAASAASGIYGASKDQILGLGLGSAAFSGARLYFGPQTKAGAYNAAGLALGCAAEVATELAALSPTLSAQANITLQELSSNIAAANDQLVNGQLSSQDRSSLLAAHDQAAKALTDLQSAITTFASAPANLENFAITVMKGAATKIVTGTQDITSVLKLIQAAPTTVPAATPVPTPRAGAPAVMPPVSISALVSQLQGDSTNAEAIAKQINDAWGTLTACTPSFS